MSTATDHGLWDLDEAADHRHDLLEGLSDAEVYEYDRVLNLGRITKHPRDTMAPVTEAPIAWEETVEVPATEVAEYMRVIKLLGAVVRRTKRRTIMLNRHLAAGWAITYYYPLEG